MLNLGKYSKLWTALAGAAVIIVGRAFGVDSAYYLDLTVLLTALGVWAAPNTAGV